MKYLALLFFLIQSTLVFPQEETKEHYIDKETRLCLEKPEGQTTLGMIECTMWAGGEWDKELNKYYKLLNGVLSVEEKEKLKTAQRNWLAFRDSEIVFSNALYGNMDGTMWRMVAASRQTDITKKRALELKSYYDDLREK